MTDRFVFGSGQRYGGVGGKVQLFGGSGYEWTVITGRDRIGEVYVQAPASGAPSSLIQYCDDDDIIIRLDGTGLSHGRGAVYAIVFPPGATRVYVSSATGTTKIYR